jgi:branched-chain amino acid transport system substrate-binding protein
MTAADHEGGGWVKIFQVKGEGFVPETQWFRAYRDLIVDREHKTAEQMAKAN